MPSSYMKYTHKLWQYLCDRSVDAVKMGTADAPVQNVDLIEEIIIKRYGGAEELLKVHAISFCKKKECYRML